MTAVLIGVNAILFIEISLEKTLKGSAVAGFVLGHLVNGIVNSVEIKLLCKLCKLEFAHGCTVFGVCAHFEVFLCAVGYDLAQKLCEFSGMLCLFKGCLFPV